MSGRAVRGRLPLAGKRIVVTRPRAQADGLVAALRALGAEPVVAPVIAIEPLPDLSRLRAALGDPSVYRWIVFTSRNAVDVVLDHLAEWTIPAGTLVRTAVAAVGPATAAALRLHGIEPALVPARFVAEELLAALARGGGLAGARVLLPQAEDARHVLADGLRAQGAAVDVIPIYRTGAAPGDFGPLAAELAAGRVDAVTFTSASTVRRFVELVGEAAARAPTFTSVTIGPVTAAAAAAAGLARIESASPFTTDGIIAALVARFS
ncbi:MAG TPA: uroporphyrinogen-III synthase [Gemmatimonadales bacterium]